MEDRLPPNAGMTLQELRDLFPITRHTAYLFHGNISPCAIPVRTAIDQFLDVWTSGGDRCWQVGAEALERSKSLFAKLIHAEPQTITSLTNTTTGINMAALMIRPRSGQNVVVTELAHMSDVYPWLAMQRDGVEIRYVPASGGGIDMQQFEQMVDDQTAVICICHVTMGTGYRFDLAQVCRIAHAHGARVVVDAAQSAGAVPIDVSAWEVDMLVAPTFKWMFGPLGAGFL